jgi:predicted nucleic acid-binding protein
MSNQTTKRAIKLSREEKISLPDSETLVLSQTLRNPLLTDGMVLSKLGKMYGLEVWDTWTVLLESLRRNLIGKQQINDAIRELGFKRHKLGLIRTEQILKAADQIIQSKAT